MAEDRNNSRTLVNIVMDLRFTKLQSISSLAEKLLVSRTLFHAFSYLGI